MGCIIDFAWDCLTEFFNSDFVGNTDTNGAELVHDTLTGITDNTLIASSFSNGKVKTKDPNSWFSSYNYIHK